MSIEQKTQFWSNNELDILAKKASKNNADFEQLLRRFRPFLWGQVSKMAGNSYDTRDEMMGAAIRAFHEAVRSYDPEKGHFYSYMSKGIYMRLIDCLRDMNSDKIETVSLDEQFDYEGGHSLQLEKASLRAHEEDENRRNLVLEITEFTEEIGKWNLTIDMLVQHSPKQDRTRRVYDEIVRQACADDIIMKTIINKHYYPVKRISKITKLPRKTVERARIYIIASIIIRYGDYNYLKSYIS